MANTGIVWLHAAAVHDGANTLVLLGTSGRGKSTTLVRAARQGWFPIAEDGCWLDVATRTLVGADHRVRLTPDSLALFGDLTTAHEEPGKDGKHELDYEAVGQRVASATLTHLVHMERSADPESAWHALDRARAVMALYQAVGIPNTERVGEWVAGAFGSLVRRTTCLRLQLGLPSAPIPPLPPPDG
jgi:hypothetical protein